MALHHFKSRHAAGLGLICAGCTLGVMLLYAIFNPYQRIEWRVTDNLQFLGRKGVLPENVVFLPIDSPSVTLDDVFDAERDASPTLQLMSRGVPFHRSVYAAIVKRLVEAGANVVVFDVLFPSAKDEDPEFAAALEKYGNRVVIGSNIEKKLGAEQKGEVMPVLIPPSSTLIPGSRMDDPRVGFVNVLPDPIDEKVRRTIFRTTEFDFVNSPHHPENTPELWSLAAQAARKAGFEQRIPNDHEPHMFRFVRDIEPLSLYAIFVDRFWKAPPYNNGQLFRDKIVLIGKSGNWTKDELETPFGLTNGPDIHLSALSAILNRDYLSETPRWMDLLLIAGAGLAAWLIGVAVGDPLQRSAIFLGLTVAYVGVAFVLYNFSGVVMQLLSPNLALLTSGGLGLVWERVMERRERLRIRGKFERYVSRDVVTEMLDNPESYVNTLEGVSRRPITVLFSDIRGFTAMTETADAALLVKQLNEYFTEMVRIVFAHRGTLDKFIGDAVMASWGGVLTRGEKPDACRAVTAALDMARAMKKLNAGWKKRGMKEFHIGLGVNHGMAICGNIGSEERTDFSAIGDAVNLASRLESATKILKVDLLIGENTADLVRDSMTLRSVDLLQVSGRKQAEATYTVLDLREAPGVPPWLEPYEQGVKLYRERSFAEAERSLAMAGELNPEDWLIREYLRRVREFKETPPPDEWDGIYALTRK